MFVPESQYNYDKYVILYLYIGQTSLPILYYRVDNFFLFFFFWCLVLRIELFICLFLRDFLGSGVNGGSLLK